MSPVWQPSFQDHDSLAWHLVIKPWQAASQMAFIAADAMSEKPAIPLGWNNGQ